MEQQIPKTNSLETLNKRFQNQKKKKKRIRFQFFFAGNRWIISAALAVALVTVCSVIAFMPKSDAEGIRNIPSGLTGDEAEKWKNKELDRDQLFIKLNTALTMKEGNKEANLTLMNPPYSAYDFRIKIVLDSKEETLLYSSDLMKPGTYLEAVEFQEGLDAGSYKATVFYTFYGDTDEVIIGEHAVPVTIEVNK